MPRTAPPAADPTEIFPFPVGQTPPDDTAYFEMLTWFVFGAGLNYKVLRGKWPGFKKAFKGFKPASVAKFTDADVDRLLADPGIVRHGKKIIAAIENAQELRAIAKEHGGMTVWLRTYGADAEALIKDTKKRFRHIGDTTARLFLACAGALEYPTWKPTERQRSGRP